MGRYLELLKGVSIFSEIDDGSLRDLESLFSLRTFAKDGMIVGQEEPGDALFVMVSGRAKAALLGDNGREVILYIFKRGDFFGEMSLIDGRPRSANVQACEETRLLVLEREVFLRHLEEHPRTALGVLQEMSSRMRYADEIIGSLALLDVYGRVARMLRDMAEREGEDHEEGVLIKQRPTQQDMAAMIGTSRETISRALNDLTRRGFIDMTGRSLLLRHAFLFSGEISRSR